MKRRWSNNGGFQTLRMLEDSSPEVTSSSALISPAMVMSPESLGSPEYGELDLWSYDDGLPMGCAAPQQPNQVVVAQQMHHTGIQHQQQQQQQQQHQQTGVGCVPHQQSMMPLAFLPPMPLPHTPNTPKSENGSVSSGREDLSPPNSLIIADSCEANKRAKKGPTPRQQEELCLVCGDRASGYHYNALTCEGCKGFFRRSVTKNAVYICKFGHECEMDMYMRRKCQECRLKKCLAVGMRPECVVPETQCAIKRKEKKAQKEKDKPPVSTTSPKPDILPAIMKCDPLPPEATKIKFLSDKLLAENRLKNVPPLTSNQEYVIARLVWYQDGYEQPSEDDLKRIMFSSSTEGDDETDAPFRHITEITILTVQLIVEFAKGLPAFTKISQGDQITLLKACSSEVMMLRMSRRYDSTSDSILFANNRVYNRDSYKVAGMSEIVEDLLHFCRQMFALSIDNVEYALLTAIVIFSDRPGLEESDLVEQIQNYYIQTLRSYVTNRYSADPKCSLAFAKLLSVLTELRTLGNRNSNMCISLKLKNRKLPRFLEEIWDVTEVDNAITPVGEAPL